MKSLEPAAPIKASVGATVSWDPPTLGERTEVRMSGCGVEARDHKLPAGASSFRIEPAQLKNATKQCLVNVAITNYLDGHVDAALAGGRFTAYAHADPAYEISKN